LAKLPILDLIIEGPLSSVGFIIDGRYFNILRWLYRHIIDNVGVGDK